MEADNSALRDEPMLSRYRREPMGEEARGDKFVREVQREHPGSTAGAAEELDHKGGCQWGRHLEDSASLYPAIL
jgi:hypothetical protein